MDRDLRIRMVLEAADRFTRPVRDMANGTGKLATALKATRERLKDVERAQADLNGFRALKRGLADSDAAMRQAQARAAALGREIAQTEQPTRGMVRTFNAAKKQAAELERQHQRNNTELGQLRDRLRAAGIATTELARHDRRLRDEAAGLNRELSEQGRRMTTLNDRTRRLTAARAGFQKTMGSASGMVSSGTAAIGTGLAVAAPVAGSIKAAQDYQSVMTDIAQKADLTRAQAEALGKQLLINARAANQLPDAMQAGVDTLSGLGAKVPDAVAMMRPIGRAATAYKAEIADLSAASFAAADNLKVPVAQTERVIEMMAAAGKAGAFEVKDMATYFPALTAAYQGLGQKGVNSVGDLAAALQITRKGAGDSASAATNLSNVLQKLMAPDTIKNFAKFGIDLPKALKRAYREGKTPIEAIAELTNKALGGNAKKIGNLDKLGFLFGDAQVQQGLRPLIQNMAEYRRIRADAQGTGSIGSVDRDFETRMKDSAEQTKALQVNVKTLGVQLGSTLLPAVNATLGRVNAFAARMSAWAQANPGFARGIMIAAAIFAALFLVLGGGAIVIAGLLAPFAALSFAATTLGIGLLPVIGIAAGVLAAIILIGLAAYGIYKHWGSISAWFSNLWQSIRAAFSGGIAGIASVLVNFSPVGLLYAGFAALMNWLGISMPARLTQAGAWLLDGLIRGITGKLAAVRNTVVGAANAVVGWFKGALGIRSPSRVFMGLGGFLTEGLALGIRRGGAEPLDQLRRVTRGIVAAGAVTVPPVAMPAVAAPIVRAVAERPAPPAPLDRLVAPRAAAPIALAAAAPDAARASIDRAAPPIVRAVTARAAERAPIERVAAPSTALPKLAEAQRLTLAGSEAAPTIVQSPRAAPASGKRDAATRQNATAAGGDTFTVTIHQQPGQSADDLLAMFERWYEGRQREKDARRRSSFRDSQDQDSLD